MNTETTPAPELSVADFKAMFNGEKTAVASPETATPTQTEVKEAVEQPPTEQPEAQETTDDKPTEQERDEQGRFKPKSEESDEVPIGVQRRIDKLTAKFREAERRSEELARQLEQLKQPEPGQAPQQTAKQPGKPKLEDFDSVEEFTDALTDWKLAQAEAEREAKAKAQQTDAKLTAARAKYADFEEVAMAPSVIDAIKAQPALGLAITESDVFAELAYHLGKNPAELTRIASLSAPRALAELGKIEARIEAQAKPTAPAVAEAPKPKAQPLPPPPVEVSATGGSGPKPMDQWDAADFRRMWQRR